jgi:hypothetical protein
MWMIKHGGKYYHELTQDERNNSSIRRKNERLRIGTRSIFNSQDLGRNGDVNVNENENGNGNCLRYSKQ